MCVFNNVLVVACCAHSGAGDSLLHAAVAAGNVDVLLVLLLHGMDTQTLNADKHTPLHVACGNCSEQVDSAAIVFTLLKYGA